MKVCVCVCARALRYAADEEVEECYYIGSIHSASAQHFMVPIDDA